MAGNTIIGFDIEMQQGSYNKPESTLLHTRIKDLGVLTFNFHTFLMNQNVIFIDIRYLAVKSQRNVHVAKQIALTFYAIILLFMWKKPLMNEILFNTSYK